MNEYWKHINPEEIVGRLTALINADNWRDSFCVLPSGERVEYASSDELVQKFACVSRGSTVYSEDIAERAIKSVFADKIKEIADWILTRKPALYLTVEFPENIGYQLLSSGERTESRTAQVSLHKEIGQDTKYGFYVSSVLPNIKKAIL
jgi:hypothetical protein